MAAAPGFVGLRPDDTADMKIGHTANVNRTAYDNRRPGELTECERKWAYPASQDAKVFPEVVPS